MSQWPSNSSPEIGQPRLLQLLGSIHLGECWFKRPAFGALGRDIQRCLFAFFVFCFLHVTLSDRSIFLLIDPLSGARLVGGKVHILSIYLYIYIYIYV